MNNTYEIIFPSDKIEESYLNGTLEQDFPGIECKETFAEQYIKSYYDTCWHYDTSLYWKCVAYRFPNNPSGCLLISITKEEYERNTKS